MQSLHLLSQINPEPLTAVHLDDVAELHYKILHWSFNGQLGKKHIRALYGALFNSKAFFGYVYYKDKRLLGFVTATLDSKDTRKHILKVYQSKVLKLALLLAKNPKTALSIAESKFLVPPVFKTFGCQAEWLTFVTDTTNFFLTPYISVQLMKALNTHFKNHGIRFYMAQGIKKNPKAIRYYEKLNWKIAKSLLMHNIYLFDTEKGG